VIRLVHFSDVHVQLPDWRTRSLAALGPLRKLATVELWKGRGKLFDDAASVVSAIVREAQALGADHLVLTGDLTQLGCEEEFALARKALGPIASDPSRFTAFAGNHDRYPLNLRPNRLFEKHFPEQALAPPDGLRVRRLGDEAALLLLETAQPWSWPVISPGRIEDEELRRLEIALRDPALRDLCKLVLVHHAPVRRARSQDGPLGVLRGADALLRVAAAGGAEAILCGHIHDRFDQPARPGRPRVICAGSSTERGDEGYWVLEIEGGRLASASVRKPG
jgi:3',5'-cyclic AMP phosphodiesterase CpdA